MVFEIKWRILNAVFDDPGLTFEALHSRFGGGTYDALRELEDEHKVEQKWPSGPMPGYYAVRA